MFSTAASWGLKFRIVGVPLAFSAKTITVRPSIKIGKFAPIPFFTEQGFWVAVVAYVVLAVGNLFRGV
jgi:hypothetical protein